MINKYSGTNNTNNRDQENKENVPEPDGIYQINATEIKQIRSRMKHNFHQFHQQKTAIPEFFSTSQIRSKQKKRTNLAKVEKKVPKNTINRLNKLRKLFQIISNSSEDERKEILMSKGRQITKSGPPAPSTRTELDIQSQLRRGKDEALKVGRGPALAALYRVAGRDWVKQNIKHQK